MKNAVKGQFVLSTKPEDGDIRISYVRLDKINIIERTNDPLLKDTCYFYTDKTDLYVCDMAASDLVEAINLYFTK